MNARFEPPFLLNRGIGLDTWQLAAPLVYHSEMLALAVTVPALFETDFASIPRFFHRLLPKNGTYDAAAVVHDYLYASGDVDKATADLVFKEALTVLKVPAWRRVAMYEAVHWFGGAAWRQHRNGTREGERLP
jgi:hypothetical protein